MPCLHIHAFIAFSFLCLIFQAPRQFFSFSSLHVIIHSIGTAIVKNRCCVFVESTLNSFCFIGNALSISSSSEAHLGLSQGSMMEVFPKIGNVF